MRLLRRNSAPRPTALHIGERVHLLPSAPTFQAPAGEFDYAVVAKCPDARFNLVVHAQYEDGLVEIIGSDARNRRHGSVRVARNGAIEHTNCDTWDDGEHEETFWIRIKPGIVRVAVVLETVRQFGDGSHHQYTTDIMAGGHLTKLEPQRQHLRITTDGAVSGPNESNFVVAIIHLGTPTITLEVPGQPAPNSLPPTLQARELAFSTS